MKKNIFWGFLVLTVVLAVRAQPVPGPDLRLQTFDKVWQTVYEKHFDANFGGVDWKKVGEVYRPKAISSETEDEFYTVLQNMLNELGQSHFVVVPPNAQITPTIFGEGEIGIDLQIIDDQVLVTRVNPGSKAAESGLRTGFIITKINEKSIHEILVPVEEKLARRQMPNAQKTIARKRSLLGSLSGRISTSVKIEVIDEKNRIRSFSIQRSAFSGEISPAMGNFPGQRMIFESSILRGNIGYIRFNIWVVPQMAKLRATLAGLSATRGLILDLRGNAGGIGAMTTALAGLLVDRETSLGTNSNRTEVNQLTVYPQDKPYPGKIVILTDAGTGSASEVFTAGMQGIKRATVVGQTTAGAVLPSVIEKLPTGATFLYAISDYKAPGNILIEGRGVKPDLEVRLSRKELLKGRDAQLESAIREIQKNK